MGSTALLVLLQLVLIDFAVTRTPLLWAPTEFETTQEFERSNFAQSYTAARSLYDPARRAPARLLIIGNSRSYFALESSRLEAEIRQLDAGLDLRVENLSIFGAGVREFEVVSRHLRAGDRGRLVA